MLEFLKYLMSAAGFMPHGHCYLWDPGLMWLHGASDAIIGLSYVAISVTLALLVQKTHQDLPYRWMFLAFGLFLVAGSGTHFMELWTLWTPIYWVSGGLKLLTATASAVTALALPVLIPGVLALVQTAKRSELHRGQLQTANQALETEIARRQQGEEALRKAYGEIEVRVAERTAELAQANTHLSEQMVQLQGAEQAIQRSEQHFRALIENSSDAILLTNPEGRVLYASPATRHVLGYPPEELTDRNGFVLIHSDDLENFKKLLAQLGSEPGPATLQVRVRRKDKSWQWAESVITQFLEDQKAPTFAVFYRDITERRRAEEERQQFLARAEAAHAEAEGANRLKDEFLATLSHELRTPMMSILGWVQMLRSEPLDETLQARALETIERNAKTQAQLIEDLLDTSRIMSGKVRLNLRPVHLALVIQAAIEVVRPAAKVKGIAIEFVPDRRACVVSGDSERLQQIISNLLSNAIKFTPEGGQVTVRFERGEREVQISIQDTGQGIRAEFLPHVFDRFRQADTSTTRRHGGLGLGLEIVRHLVERHGGTVSVASPGEGQGATFTVSLPLERNADTLRWRTVPALRESSMAASPPPVLDGLRVLVVDDEADARAVITAVLERSKAIVQAAGSVPEALEALERFRPDVLVSDLGMPRESGYDLIRQVRALGPERGGRVPAMALTACTRAEDRTRALAAGYQAYLTKPVELDDLANMVAAIARPLKGREQSH